LGSTSCGRSARPSEQQLGPFASFGT
jgi:hypothetical protein